MHLTAEFTAVALQRKLIEHLQPDYDSDIEAEIEVKISINSTQLSDEAVREAVAELIKEEFGIPTINLEGGEVINNQEITDDPN